MKIKADTETNTDYEQHAELPPCLPEPKRKKPTCGPVSTNFRRLKKRRGALSDKQA